MYEFIEGRIIEKNPAFLVLENHGIGYLLQISLGTYAHIKDLNECRLFTHFAIKNEANTATGFSLFGFFTDAERQLFRLLISVSGVGNNTALLMLSSLSPEKIYQAIASESVSVLQSVKGIGSKTAQHIIVDLKNKIGKHAVIKEIMDTGYNTKKMEALTGLTSLGFSKPAAEKILDRLLKQDPNLQVDQLLKEALKQL